MGSRSEKHATIKELYAEWLRLPNRQARVQANVPLTKQDFAAFYGVDRTTLYDWEKDPEFKKAVQDGILGLFCPDDIRKVKEVLLAEALNGSIPAIKLIGDWSGITGKTNRVVEEVETEDALKKKVERMSLEQLEAVAKSDDFIKEAN